MRTWLSSLINAILGRIPGKTSRLDTATRMAMEADFSYRDKPKSPARPRERERDDVHLIKRIGPSADAALFEQLVRIVNEAQERDAKTKVGCIAQCLSLCLGVLNESVSIPGHNSRSTYPTTSAPRGAVRDAFRSPC
jgi:hypothetical protein